MMRPISIRRAGSVMLLVATGLIAACRPSDQGAIRVAAIGPQVEFVDPAAGPLTAPTAVLLANSAQGLVRFDARGQIEPGLAERWNVSDDGLSYIFRIASTQWPGGGRVTAQQVAQSLKRQIGGSSRNSLKDSLAAVEDIVAMTDRVIEIRLTAPRPNLLNLLAQPELAVVRDRQGTGPFQVTDTEKGQLRLEQSVAAPDTEEERLEDVWLTSATAREAVEAFRAETLDLVVGGTFADLPLARAVELPRDSLRFDPVSGLFGLMPVRDDGPLANPELRRLLSQALDREALIAAFGVAGLLPRATVLEAGLEGVADPLTPPWLGIPMEQRRAALQGAAERLFADQPRSISVALPEGPGSRIVLQRLQRDWGALGIRVEQAATARSADLRLVDEVASSLSPAWFVRHFRCDSAAICSGDIDGLLDSARASVIPAQRSALLAEAGRLIDEQILFIPITAPIRWSLVSPRVVGFAGNRFGRHTLTSLDQALDRERAE